MMDAPHCLLSAQYFLLHNLELDILQIDKLRRA